jgi:hypothetical protein
LGKSKAIAATSIVLRTVDASRAGVKRQKNEPEEATSRMVAFSPLNGRIEACDGSWPDLNMLRDRVPPSTYLSNRLLPTNRRRGNGKSAQRVAFWLHLT